MSVNLGRVAYVEKGKYKSDTTYESKDVVSFNGGSYVFIGDTPAANVPPTNEANWQPLIDPTAMNDKIAELDGIKEETLTAAATANEKAQEATAAAETANTAAQRADEARESLRTELNGKASVITNDASGDMVHIADGAAMPVQRLITHIAPAADGSGWDVVKAHRKGKNLVNAKVDATSSNVTANGDNGIIVMNGTASASSSTSLKIYEITLKPGTYTMSHKVLSGSAEGASASTSVLLYKVNGTIKHRTRFESPSVTFVVTEEETARIEIIRGGSAATYNAFTFSVQLESGETATDFEPPNMQTLTVNLLEEVTDGEIDWLNGTLTKADGNTVQLEKQNLSTLKGTNNIWSDAGETSVIYFADTKLYIDNKIAAIAAAIVNE